MKAPHSPAVRQLMELLNTETTLSQELLKIDPYLPSPLTEEEKDKTRNYVIEAMEKDLLTTFTEEEVHQVTEMLSTPLLRKFTATTPKITASINLNLMMVIRAILVERGSQHEVVVH